MNTGRTYTASQARENFSEVFDTAIHEGPVFVRKRQKEVVVMSSDLLHFLTDVEAMLDNEKARKALREFLQKGGTPMNELKEELGIT